MSLRKWKGCFKTKEKKGRPVRWAEWTQWVWKASEMGGDSEGVAVTGRIPPCNCNSSALQPAEQGQSDPGFLPPVPRHTACPVPASQNSSALFRKCNTRSLILENRVGLFECFQAPSPSFARLPFKPPSFVMTENIFKIPPYRSDRMSAIAQSDSFPKFWEHVIICSSYWRL